MALTIDGGAVLVAFATDADLYPTIQGDLVEFARKMLLKQLKSPSIEVESFRKIWQSAGTDNMTIMLDGMSPSELSSLMKKIDPYSSHVKAAEAQATRSHIADLVSGHAAPSLRSERQAGRNRTGAPAKKPVSKIGEVLGSKVHRGGTARKRPTKS